MRAGARDGAGVGGPPRSGPSAGSHGRPVAPAMAAEADGTAERREASLGDTRREAIRPATRWRSRMAGGPLRSGPCGGSHGRPVASAMAAEADGTAEQEAAVRAAAHWTESSPRVFSGTMRSAGALS